MELAGAVAGSSFFMFRVLEVSRHFPGDVEQNIIKAGG
jgi:hypothetical protein